MKCELVCSNCHRVREYERAASVDKHYNKNSYRKFHREYVNSIKNKPCTDCSKIFILWVMELDHRDDEEKIKTISQMVGEGYSLKNIKKEIDKCDVVCSNCHRIRTYNRNQYIKRNIDG